MSIQYVVRDSNPRPLEHESSPTTTSRGLPRPKLWTDKFPVETSDTDSNPVPFSFSPSKLWEEFIAALRSKTWTCSFQSLLSKNVLTHRDRVPSWIWKLFGSPNCFQVVVDNCRAIKFLQSNYVLYHYLP